MREEKVRERDRRQGERNERNERNGERYRERVRSYCYKKMREGKSEREKKKSV